MKKVYNSPQAKESKTKLEYTFCGNSLTGVGDGGTTEIGSKDVSNFEGGSAQDDDFWSTTK